jgi:carbon-monoxide dehydrogenase small subunit
MNLSISINGSRFESDVEPHLLLVELIRDSAKLTGTKVGCDTGNCGSCVVLVDGVSVKSCSKLALQVNGSSIVTIEGVAQDGKLSVLQEAFQEMHGLQCGFCTPGMVMSVMDLLNSNASPTETEIREALYGNVCRCTGYQNVVSAVQHAIQIIKKLAING